VPWNPEVVLNQLKPAQKDLSPSRRRGRQPSSSPSVDLDSPTARRKIRTIVNQVVEQKAQEDQQKRDDRVAALAAKKEAAAVEKATKAAIRTAKRAQKQLEKDSKVKKKVSKGRVAKKRVVKKPAVIMRHPLAQIAPNQQSSGSGRIFKTPRHHSDI
jgi:hypothetical protein